jgi:membrane protein implicated in regulation of membrane protease activity
MIFVAAAGLGLAFGAARGWLPRATLPAALVLFVAAAVTAVWLGFKSHRQALADRERQGRLSMIVAIAAQLGKQNDATLERVAGKGGPAGEAARMILKGRLSSN